MAPDMQNTPGNGTLDDFFDAAGANDKSGLRQAAERISVEQNSREDAALDEEAAQFALSILNARNAPGKSAQPETPLPPLPQPADTIPSPPVVVPDELTGDSDENLDGKFIAIDPDAIPGMANSDPFVLVPANIHAYVPWWGWVTIAAGLAVFIAGVVLLPGISLNRLASRLGDKNEATAQQAMRQLVVKGDERTVRKLFDMASSSNEGLTTRLRAVDTMSLIDRVPEVDSALLRLELSSGTHNQVREAAIAARKQREAYRTRQNR